MLSNIRSVTAHCRPFFFFYSGVIKHQVNLDTHSPGCEMATNPTNQSGNISHVVWCSEDPVFQADKPEVTAEAKPTSVLIEDPEI